jgi:hypothetical protein
MKKFLFLTLVFSALIALTTHAQNGSGPATTPQQPKEATDPAVVLQQTKEKVAPLMVEKTGLTLAQANKVIEILFEMRQAAGALRDLSEADRSAKLAELKADKDKKFSELLTPEQIIAVKKFYEEMGKNREQKNN